MELSTELRGQVWRTEDWPTRVVELEWEAKRLTDPWARSEAYVELGRLAEDLIADRERALRLYSKAWRSNGDNLTALARARVLARELMRLDVCAEIAEAEYRACKEPELLVSSAEAWLDAGFLEQAEALLLRAVEVLGPSIDEINDALSVCRAVETPMTEVARFEREAKTSAPDVASRKYVCAALCARFAGARNPQYEILLRHALDLDPYNHRAVVLLEQQLESEHRWVEYIELHELRAELARSDRERVEVYRHGGMTMFVRYNQEGAGARLISTALNLAYERNVGNIPAHLAMLGLLAGNGSGPGYSNQMLLMYDRALGCNISEDERVFIATTAGKLAWKELEDLERAQRYFAMVKGVVPDHPTVTRFERQIGKPLTTVRRPVEGETQAKEALFATERAMGGMATRPYIDGYDGPRDFTYTRREPRVHSQNVLTAKLVRTNLAFKAYSRDLSASGIYVFSESVVVVGDTVSMTVRIPAENGWAEETYELVGRVVRHDAGKGFAAALERTSEGYSERVHTLITSVAQA